MFLVRVLMLLLAAAGTVEAAPVAADGALLLSGERDLDRSLALRGHWRLFRGRQVTPATLPAVAAQAVAAEAPTAPRDTSASGAVTTTYWLPIDVADAITRPVAVRFERLCGAGAVYFFRDGDTAATPLLQRAGGNAATPLAGSDTLLTLPALSAGRYHLLVQQTGPRAALCGPVTLGFTAAQMRSQTLLLSKHVVIIALLLFLAMGSLVLGAQNGERAIPWLALMCTALGALLATSSGVFEALVPPGSRWLQQWQYALTFVALTWIPAALLMLVWRTLAVPLPRLLIAANLAVAGLLSLLFLVLPAARFVPFTGALVAVGCAQLLIALGAAVIAVRLHRRYAAAVLAALVPLLIIGPYDFHRYTALGITELWTPYAAAFLIAVHGWIFTLKFGSAYQLAARLSENLQEEVELRTRELRDKNSKLQQTQNALQKANEALKLLSITDGLTQVYNRMYFEQQFEREWRRCSRQGLPLSVLMIDADHFKQLNDSAGHLTGDRCLQTIAGELECHFKRAGELVARYGGEEFIVLLPDTNQSKALAVAEGVRAAIEKLQIEHSGRLYRVTISIGVSTTIPSTEQPGAQLLATADAALYEAKDSGRNRVHSIPLLGQRRVMAQQQLRL